MNEFSIPPAVAKKVENFAKSKKMTIDEAAIFLISKVSSPIFLPEKVNTPPRPTNKEA